jgi:MFS family permease
MYFGGTATAFLADNIEHVITYWMIFQKFHSSALGGFAVLSHWIPFLLFSVYSGALADRFDPRRIIQIGMGLFMCVSLVWGFLFLSGTLQMWEAMVLLVLHGVAGVLWTPASQLLLHDIVRHEQVPSAVRLGATARYLGMLSGPAVGGALLLMVGPARAMFVNALIYLPMLIWLWKAPYGPRFRTSQVLVMRGLGGLRDIITTLRQMRDNTTVFYMTLLAGSAAFFVGNAYQAQMPGFAQGFGHGNPGVAYSMLLAADAGGALLAGFILESPGILRVSPRTAMLLALSWCGALAGFALTGIYGLALVLLFSAGFLELAFNSMAQALVQLNAPPEIRGRAIGVFTTAANGMKTFSGVSVGLLGSLIGIHWSLAISSIAVLAATLGILAHSTRAGARERC